MAEAAQARRITELELALHRERMARLKAEQAAGGLKSAVLRMQAKLAQRRADDLRAEAEHAA